MAFMKFLLIAILLVTSVAQAAFVPPADGPVPFRRDKLPVDVDTMVALSKQLVLLVGTTDITKPEEARRAAQTLGVALALDPTNRQGHELRKRLKKELQVKQPNRKEVEQAASRVWHLMSWLEVAEAGVDGNALAACLSDIMVGVDPDHPRAVKLAESGEKGKWLGWVSPIEAFGDPEPSIASANTAEESASREENPSNSLGIPLKLQSASIEIPLWYYIKKQKDAEKSELKFGPRTVTMIAQLDGKHAQVKVKLPDLGKNKWDGKFASSLNEFLVGRYGKVPAGLHFKFQLEGESTYLRNRNGDALLAAVFVLADSALSGVPPAGMFLAVPTSDGNLELPARFWQTMRVLSDSDVGGRLVLPTSAKEFMPPLITLEKSPFFFNFEVLLAEDIGELCKLASSVPPQEVEEAHKAFEAIRLARGSRSLGSFLNYEATQQRLRQLITLFPSHVSARMLALRGTSQWPKRLPRTIYAREIRAAIEPLDSYFKRGRWYSLDGMELEETADRSRDELAIVERLYDSVSDRQDLHAPALNLVKLVSSLAVDAKRSGENNGERYEHEATYLEAWTEYVRVIELLTLSVKDSGEYPLPVLESVR